MHPVRIRLAVGLVSAAALQLEIVLLRLLSLRFWDHVAQMVVAVALLGFGASGPVLLLLGRRLPEHAIARALAGLSAAFALSLPALMLGLNHLPLLVPYLAWDPRGPLHVLALELLLFPPFLFAGMLTGLILTDLPERLPGHYAATLGGSGGGAIVAVILLLLMAPAQAVLVSAVEATVAAALLLRWRVSVERGAGLIGGVVLAAACAASPRAVVVSEYKALPQLLSMPDTRLLWQRSGPMGRLDVVSGSAVHYAPGLSLRYSGPVPDHALLLLDGEPLGALYATRAPGDWQFLDSTTMAAPYALRQRPRVLVVGAGGGSDIGLACWHGAARVTALEMNRDLITAMAGPLASRGGALYHAPGVTVLNREARTYLAGCREHFDLIQVPLIDAFGAVGAGLYAGRESGLYTTEAFGQMLERLSPDGILAVTRWARTPPREGLRVLDTAATALRRRGLPPAAHLAMLRNWATVTVLAFRRPITATEAETLRRFCQQRGFDLCHLPGLLPAEANRFHVLERPYYHEAASALLGPGRDEFLARYPFAIGAATDDQPYFYHFFRWGSLRELVHQTGARSRAFLEMGYVLALATLVQTTVAAAALLLLPLLPATGPLRGVTGKATAAAYFLGIGTGFMLLEMSLFQQFIRYLGDPVFSAATVIASFLVFGGVGSLLSGRWGTPAGVVATRATVLAATLALAAVALLPGWLGLSQGLPLAVRVAVAAVTVAPLATTMGHAFPAGLLLTTRKAPALAPWLWGVNGFASVVATAAAPLLSMAVGLRAVGCLAAACYGLAAVCAWRLGHRPRAEPTG